MVAGDVVNGISATGTIMSFQPAAGVEVMITSVSVYNTWLYVTDGSPGIAALTLNYGTTTYQGNALNTKIMINNTNYIMIDVSTGQETHYTGIQIK